MIQIEGTIDGSLREIYYSPSDSYMRDLQGNIIIGARFYANVIPKDDMWWMWVNLPDVAQLTSPSSNPWYWICHEVSDVGEYVYALTSEARQITYAQSRPRRAREVS